MKFLICLVAILQLHAIPWMFPETLLTREKPATGVVSKIDSHGDAIAVWIAADRSEIEWSVYEAATQAWRTPKSLHASSTANMAAQPALCMSEEGKAIAFWVQGADLVARVRVGGIISGHWEPPLEEEPYRISSGLIAGIAEIDADMNGVGDAAVIWSETRTHPLRDVAVARRYVDGLWEPPLEEAPYCLYDDQRTDTIDLFPSVQINASGDLAAVWKFNGNVVARQFKGEWLPALNQEPWTLSGARGRSPRGGIDQAGNLYAVWVRDEMVEATQIVSGVPGPIFTLGMAIDAPDLAVSPNGTAVAVWPSLGDMIFASTLSQGVWDLPMMISQIGAARPAVAMDASGNAIVAWENSATGTVQMAERYRKTWQTPEDLFPIGGDPLFASVALSPSGNTLVSWETRTGTGEVAVCLKNPLPPAIAGMSSVLGELLPNVTPRAEDRSSQLIGLGDPPSTSLSFPPVHSLAALGDPPEAPSLVSGRKVRNQFGFVSEIFHEVNWGRPADPAIVGYQVFVNNKLVSQLPRTATSFRDHNKQPGASVMYHIRAINAEGLQSHPLMIAIQ